MSRIGKKPVELPKDVQVALQGSTLTVKGPKGSLSFTHRPEVSVRVEDNKRVVVDRRDDSKAARAYHGTTRAQIQNMVKGVAQGFQKELEVVGVGWTAKVQGKKLTLNVGYADPRQVEIPAGVSVVVDGQKITVSGIDKQAVGQFAAQARAHRKPEPYNGKGIKYINEVIIRKEGKAFAGSGGG